MFRPNDEHLQHGLFDTIQQMSEKTRKRLESSWAGTFYNEVFCRIDETRFAKLYADTPSRPNIPVNILVGLEILKAGFGWSDEEMYDEFLFSLQVHYALGIRGIGDIEFELRTVYNFRQRLSQHMQETGENLLEEVFVQVTDEQLDALKLKTGHQRMDSTLVGSNIRQTSRLQLLVEVLHRVWRMLEEEDRVGYAEAFGVYREGTAGQFCYRVKGEDVPGHLEAIGELMHRLVRELETGYADHPTYRVLARVFDEHFALSEADAVRVKEGEELSASSLQSPDDWEATYREKRGEGQKGYVVNLTETCDPENPVQLITQIQVAPNVTDDEKLLVEGVPDLKARTELEALWTDGGYNGPDAEEVMRSEEVEHIPTAIRGGRPSSERLGLDAFNWEMDEDGAPTGVECPGGQSVPVTPGRKDGRYLACFDDADCAKCPSRDRCPAEPLRSRPSRVLRVNTRQVQVAQLRQRSLQTRGTGNNLRAAVESTVRSVIHPFGGHNCKLPVRGQVRVTQMIIGSALMSNLRRIWSYEQRLERQRQPEGDTFLSRCRWRLEDLVYRCYAHLVSAFVPYFAKV